MRVYISPCSVGSQLQEPTGEGHQHPARGVQSKPALFLPSRQVSFLRLAYGQLRPGTELSGSEARSPVGSLGSKLCCHAFLRGSQPASALLYLARLSHGAVVTTGLQRNVPFHTDAGKEEGL